jgi:tRNA threonylcarbamoyladenosine biosynthesis protein TsaB
MLILTIRTDKPKAEIGLFRDGKTLAYTEWEAHRQLARTVHEKVRVILDEIKGSWTDIEGIAVYKGPGSFTGLRIGASIANALAYGLKVPVISASGENWIKDGIQALASGKGQNIVLPEYGSDPNITQPRK